MSPQEIAKTVSSDRFMVEPARFVARIWEKAALPVWQFHFGYVAGNPNATDLPVWNAYSSQKDNILFIPATGAEHTREMVAPWRARLNVIEKLAESGTPKQM